MLRDNWPMILALAAAVAIGWLVFTVLRPSPIAPVSDRPPARMAATGGERS
jgi:hypothetical protein